MAVVLSLCPNIWAGLDSSHQATDKNQEISSLVFSWRGFIGMNVANPYRVQYLSLLALLEIIAC